MSDHACRHTESAYDYLTGRLSGADRSAFEAHLAGCDSCRAELAQLEMALGHLAAWTPPRLSPAFTGDVLARLGTPRPGPAARLLGWFRFRPLPLAAGALVAAGLVVAVIGFFPQILSQVSPRYERKIARPDLVARGPRVEEGVKMKRAETNDIVRPRSQPTGGLPAPSPPPPAPPAARPRPAPPKARAETAVKSIPPSARPRFRMAARPRPAAPAPGAADRYRSGGRAARRVAPAPGSNQHQSYSVVPPQRLLSRKPSTTITRRGAPGMMRTAPQVARSVRPAQEKKATPLKAAGAILRGRQRLPQNLAMVLSLVERYGGRVNKPYRTTPRGLILEVNMPPKNRRVFLTRLRGLTGQGITRLGTDLAPIRVLVSKSSPTGSAAPAR
jgi:hypothetical protein